MPRFTSKNLLYENFDVIGIKGRFAARVFFFQNRVNPMHPKVSLNNFRTDGTNKRQKAEKQT